MTQEQKMDILLVDDEAGHSELIKRNLRRAGITSPMISLTRGQEALDYVFRRKAHRNRVGSGQLVILLDIRMPGSVDGFEVLRQLKADPIGRKIPVIILTTTDGRKDVSRCYDLGCSLYMAKPVDPALFTEALRRLGQLISVVSFPFEETQS